jgi:Toxin co-regulated pilus biosynthesis protein Q
MNNKNKQKLSQLAIGVMLTLTSFYSFAGGSLTQVGEPKNKTYNQSPLKGFANELPLLTVMKQITPNGWIVKKSDTEDNKLDVKKSISWHGGKSWLETLTEISENYNINTVVDWNKKTITLSNVTIEKDKEPTKKGLFVLEGSEPPKIVKDVAVGSSEQNQDAVKEVTENKVVAEKVEPTKTEVATQPAAPVIPSWVLEPSLSLRDNVEKWANSAGYRLVWTGEDYGVGQGHTIMGEFDAENGPIKQLSVDYGPGSRVQVPLSFQFYQNKTLVVENWLFEQSGFPQFSKKK